ncbi:MAG: DUF5703 domain-containing protein [Phycisphaerae bacterium]
MKRLPRVAHGCTVVLLLFGAACPGAVDAAEAAHRMDPYNVVWTSPSQDHHGSMPLGNGSTGLNAWINPAGELAFYISRTDSWGDNARLLKVGKVRIALDPPPPTAPFEQTLSLKDATMVVRCGKGDGATVLRLWADANHPVIHVTVDSARPVTATAAIELWRTEPRELPSIECSDVLNKDPQRRPTIVEPDTILKNQAGRIRWYHRNVKSVGPAGHARVQGMTGYERPDPLLHRTFGAIVTAEGDKRIDDTHLESPAGGRHRFSIYVDTLHPATEAQWLARMDQHIRRVGATDFASRRAAHEAWWTERWNRSWIVAEQSDAIAGGVSPIPANDHPVRLGIDQHGANKLAARFGRLSVLGRTLTDEQVAALAARPHDRPLRDESGALFAATAAEAGPIADSADWDFSGGMTVEAWIRPTRAGAGGGRIVDKITPGGSDGVLFDTHRGVRLIVGRETLSYAETLPADAWSHVAAVVPAGGRPPRVYLNGEPLPGDEPAAGKDSELLGDAEVVSRAYALQRFIDICAGRGAYPIKFNGSIFTVPHAGKPGDADYRRWGPGYWWQNTRLPYISMCTSGDTDLMRPLFAQYIDRFLPLNRYRTKQYFGHGGAYYIECVHFWGDVFNECYGWTPVEQRKDPLQASGWHKWEWVCGPELVYMALDYYEHTGDEAFLKEKVLPTAEAVMTFFEEYYDVDSDGKLVMHPSQAVETWWDCTNPMPELAGLIAVADRLLALPARLTTPAQRAAWTAFRKKLPALPTREVDGKQAFAPAERFENKRNSENPELYCVFPFRLASFNRPNAPLAVNALNHRWDKGHVGWRQDDIFMAYLGLAGEARRNLVARARKWHRGSRFPAFWGPNYDWIPDQDHGGVLMKALQAMLMQAEPATGSECDGKIYLLPAWPKDWNVEFRLHAPRGTTVECTFRDGKVRHLAVTPPERRADVIHVEPQ